jgi:hypothetical protein
LKSTLGPPPPGEAGTLRKCEWTSTRFFAFSEEPKPRPIAMKIDMWTPVYVQMTVLGALEVHVSRLGVGKPPGGGAGIYHTCNQHLLEPLQHLIWRELPN